MELWQQQEASTDFVGMPYDSNEGSDDKPDCNDFNYKVRDDKTHQGETMFCVLLIIYLICQLFTLAVTILMLLKIGKTKAKR